MDLFLSFSTVWLVAILAFFVTRFGGHLHKHEYTYYWGFTVLTVIATLFSLLAQFEVIDVARTPILYNILWQGHLTLALFILVMFAGAFKKKSKPKITLMKVRREMAIIGFLTLIPHATLLIVTALSALNPTGTLALLIMIPLFVTSFPKIRKKMHPLKWRKLHHWAYAAYAMIFLHLASITLIAQRTSDTNGYNQYWWLRLTLYTLIFSVYSVLKYKNYLKPAPQTT